MTLNALDPDAFKLLYLWIHQANGRSSTLAELMTLAHMTLHKVTKATGELARHGLANVSGHLAHSPTELTINAFNLFALPTFDIPLVSETKLDETPGSIPSNALVEVPVEVELQNSLQKNFFSDAESLRSVVVVKSPDHDLLSQPQQLGTDGKNFLPTFTGDDEATWPIREICEAHAVKPRRHPGTAYQKTFIAWLIYAYEHKAPKPDEPGIKSPVHFALANLTNTPSRLYLDLAQAGPLSAIEAMEDWYYRSDTPTAAILTQAKKNGFLDLLTPYFPDDEDDDDQDSEDDDQE